MKWKFFYLLLSLSICLSTNEVKGQAHSTLSFGASLGGKGFAGVSAQLRPLKSLALDLGLYLKATHVDVFEEIWFAGPAADCGINVFLNRRVNKQKERIITNGLFFKAGFGLNKKGEQDIKRLNEKSAGFGWLMEISKINKQGKFLQIQLGPSLIQRHESFLNTRYPPEHQLQQDDWSTAMIYARVTWFFAALKSKDK